MKIVGLNCAKMYCEAATCTVLDFDQMVTCMTHYINEEFIANAREIVFYPIHGVQVNSQTDITLFYSYFQCYSRKLENVRLEIDPTCIECMKSIQNLLFEIVGEMFPSWKEEVRIMECATIIDNVVYFIWRRNDDIDTFRRKSYISCKEVSDYLIANRGSS